MLSLLIIGFIVNSQPLEDGQKDTIRFNKGELLQFKLSYGWFTVGKADLKVDTQLHEYLARPCYKVDISGRTAGLVGIFARVDDVWGAYVSEETLLPVMAYADIKEGNYTRNERIHFNQETGDIMVEMTKREKKRPTKYYDFGPEIHDLISGYLHLRNVDFSSMDIGDTVRFKAFYDEIFYDFKVVMEGKEMIRSKVGELLAYKLVPLIPENKIFPGEKPITAWVSADANQLPLRISARMFFGTAYCELTNYQNIKYGVDFDLTN